MPTLDELRSDFERRTNRSMSMPIAGMIVWSAIGAVGTALSFESALLVMMASTGAIFPLALLIARFRREELVSRANPLAGLMGLCVLMVNLLWGVHLSLYFGAPQYVPLSLGIALGLHWIVYSWIIDHPLGIVHAILRTCSLVIAWLMFPDKRVPAIAIVIVCVYIISLVQMATRRIAPVEENIVEKKYGQKPASCTSGYIG